jgi:hypothetical protein
MTMKTDNYIVKIHANAYSWEQNSLKCHDIKKYQKITMML